MLKVSLVLLAIVHMGSSAGMNCPDNKFFPKALKAYAHLGSDYGRAADKSVCPGTGVVSCSRTIGGVTNADYWDGVSVVALSGGVQIIDCSCVDDPSLNCAAEFEVWTKEAKDSGELNVGAFTELGTVNNEFNDIEASFVVCPSVALGNNGGRNVVISIETSDATFPLSSGGTVDVTLGDYVLQRMDATPGVTNADLNSLSCGELTCTATDDNDSNLVYTFTVPIGSHTPIEEEVFWVLPTTGTKWTVDCECTCGSSGSQQWAARNTRCAKTWSIEKNPI